MENDADRIISGLNDAVAGRFTVRSYSMPASPAWQPMETAPSDARVLVNFKGAGPIVAYRDPEFPAMWVRYLGYGKSTSWPTVHEDCATHWMPLPLSPTE